MSKVWVMRILAVGLLVAASVLLVGCAPNTDAAYHNCMSALAPTGSTTQDTADAVVICNEQRKADPVAFNEQWG